MFSTLLGNRNKQQPQLAGLPASQVPTHPITGEILDVEKELIKCAKDPAYFINTYGWLKSPRGGTVPFKLYPFQERTVNKFLQHKYCVILKSRQMGISQLSAAYASWHIIFQPSRDVLCIANKQKTATKMIDKVKFFIGHLPLWLKKAMNCDRYSVDNRESIQLFNNSKIEASSTTEDAARGDTLSLLIVDEAASIRNAEETWTSLEPTLEIGGSCIVLSTPKGVGNWFHSVWADAESEINGFHPILLGWEEHPDRDEQWALRKIRSKGERLFAREYACRFDQSGNTLIKSARLMMMEEKWIDDPIEKKNGEYEGLWIWEHADPTRKYIVSADTASGEDDDTDDEGESISTTDYCAAVVIDMLTRTVVAEYYGKLRPLAYCKVLHHMCMLYNQALFVYDNTGGWSSSFYEIFQGWNYTRIYHQPKNKNNKFQVNLLDERNKPGFTIKGNNRNDIISELEQRISTSEEEEQVFRSKRCLNEFKTFIWNGKRHEALKGKHDDIVMAMAMGYKVCSEWVYYHGGDTGNSMAMGALYGLRSKNNMSNLPTKRDDRLRDTNAMPISSKTYKKNESFANAFIDPKSGEDLRVYIDNYSTDDQKKEKTAGHDNSIQRSIFDNPLN